ncbi:prostaglandin D2 receptor 2 [Kryptolebias marmoratus]|uniref:Prostaglandin D2 receptor 2 n=1 Tax=Kryptolebias marmoratus TaxID=37003 RepID=A0A3Q2ZI37_KRYMA|nr:prostaglandin D2 receptor 2 [Kryptolebias marmoratus]XP_024858538.1 prostaglandin D2 receptor 2 [Kryptolebias marmoratus]
MASCPSPNSSMNVFRNQTYQPEPLSAGSLFTISFLGIVSIIGVAENVLILGVIGFRVRRSIISLWILNLASSDLLATCTLPFFTLYIARGYTWILGSTFCRIYSSMFFLNMFVSAFLLAAISLDRCLVVVKPVLAQNYRSMELVGRVCGVIWVCAVICTIPFHLFREAIPLPSGKVLCYYNYAQFLPSEPFDLKALCRQRKDGLVIMKFLFAFLIPLLIIILSYVAVNYNLARRGSRRPFRFVRLVVAVVVTFVLCWSPYHIFILMEMMSPKGSPAQKFATKFLPIATGIGFLNSVINPILYVFSCPDLCRKIRHSLGAVMESVLAEDLGELTRRRSTARSTVSASEFVMRKKSSIPALTRLKSEDSEQVESLSNSH